MVHIYVSVFLKKFFLLPQVPARDDDEFCNIWQSLQGSGKVQHFQPLLQEKVSIPCLMDISFFFNLFYISLLGMQWLVFLLKSHKREITLLILNFHSSLQPCMFLDQWVRLENFYFKSVLDFFLVVYKSELLYFKFDKSFNGMH